MIYFFYTLHVMVGVFLILVVLLQQGKGADLSVFGGGGTMTAFGARGAATFLHKMTVFSFIAFIITTLAIGIMQGRESGSTVMSGVSIEEAVGDTEENPEEAVGVIAEDAEPTDGAETSPAGEADSSSADGNTDSTATDDGTVAPAEEESSGGDTTENS